MNETQPSLVLISDMCVQNTVYMFINVQILTLQRLSNTHKHFSVDSTGKKNPTRMLYIKREENIEHMYWI